MRKTRFTEEHDLEESAERNLASLELLMRLAVALVGAAGICLAGCAPKNPYGPRAVHRLYASTDGAALAAVTQGGLLAVWALEQGVAERPRFERGPLPYQSLALVDALGSAVIWTCRAGELCATNLSTGLEATLVNYGGDDKVVLGVSGLGGALVVGTQAGAILAISGDLATRRRRDAGDEPVEDRRSLHA